MENPNLEEAVLELVGRTGYRPVKPRVIAQKLRVPKGQVAEVKRAIKRLIARRQLAYGPSHQVRPADPAHPGGNRLVGVFRRQEAGYGLVRPLVAVPGDPRAADIYIPPQKAGDASTGDVVVVRLDKRRVRGRPGPRGEIVEVIQRQTRTFVGTYYESGGAAYVQVDGTLFSRPIAVGDPGASGVAPDDKVVFEMVRFPSHLRDGEGVITEVLGPRGKPGVDTLMIIREFNLPGEFADDALQAARQQTDAFDA